MGNISLSHQCYFKGGFMDGQTMHVPPEKTEIELVNTTTYFNGQEPTIKKSTYRRSITRPDLFVIYDPDYMESDHA